MRPRDSAPSTLSHVTWILVLSLCIKSHIVTIQMKATEQYFPVVLFIMLYRVVLTLSL